MTDPDDCRGGAAAWLAAVLMVLFLVVWLVLAVKS